MQRFMHGALTVTDTACSFSAFGSDDGGLGGLLVDWRSHVRLLGEAGWELVAVVESLKSTTFFFKRSM